MQNGPVNDQADVVEALGVAVAARVPVVLWGAPGTGKTSVVRALADAAGWPCETVIASIREPSDFAGLPIINRGERLDGQRRARRRRVGRSAWPSPDDGLLFFDEISTAPPAVQAALLRVVLERTVGDLTLPDEVSVVAAANPPGAGGGRVGPVAAAGQPVLPPRLAGRRADPGRRSLDGVGARRPRRCSTAGWEQRIAVHRSWVAGFVTVRPMLAFAVPDEAAAGPGERGRALARGT